MHEILKGKRILVVEDEVDVWKVLRFELATCTVDHAGTYEEGRERLGAGGYDLAILDMLGVRGFDLLEEFGRKIPCIVLTARALTEKDLSIAMEHGAALFVPKHEIGGIDEYVAKVLEGQRPLWGWLFRRVDFARWFGPGFKPPALR